MIIRSAHRCLITAAALATAGCSLFPSAPTERAGEQVVLSAGKLHTCAVTARGNAYCWGHNTYGELGDGTSTPRAVPVEVVGGHRFVALSAGVNYTCALTADGAAWCWGQNDMGQLGIGVLDLGRTAPSAVAGGHAFVSIMSGEGQTCALDAGGGLWCWGQVLGAPGVPRFDSIPRRLDARTYAALGAGYGIACAIAGGHAYCWGDHPPGVPLDSTDQPTDGPRLVPGGPALVTLSAGVRHACAVTSAGAGVCWGANRMGELGSAVGDSTDTPTPVEGRLVFAAISARSPAHSCGVTPDETVYCWGANAFGQLGDGSTAGSATPARLATDVAFVSVAVGYYHSCGVAGDGTVLCWGMGSVGQLGTGDTTSSEVPRVARFPKTR